MGGGQESGFVLGFVTRSEMTTVQKIKEIEEEMV